MKKMYLYQHDDGRTGYITARNERQALRIVAELLRENNDNLIAVELYRE